MTWTRLSDDFIDRLEVMELSDAAFRLHVSAMVYGNRMTTDGYVPTRALRRLTDGSPDVLADELVESGLWTPEGEGFRLDWSAQEASEQVQARRQRNAEANRKYRERRDLHRAGDHSKCDPRFCPSREASHDGPRDGPRDESRDVPRDASRQESLMDTRPVPLQGKGGKPRKGPRKPPQSKRPRAHDCTIDGHKLVADGTCALCEYQPDREAAA